VNLLGAELRKLRRPLLWGTTVAAMGFFVLLAWGATQNASSGVRSPNLPGECRVVMTPACTARAQQEQAQGRAGSLDVAKLETPGGAGRVAAGMLASVPGVVIVALLAGAHAGGEFSGGTIRTALTHDGRRLRFLAAKWASLWLAAIGVTLACWIALGLAGPWLAAAYHLPAVGAGSFSGVAGSATQLARATVVLGLFTLVGVAAAAVTRNTVGTIAAVVGVFVVALIVGGIPAVAHYSPATSIQAWMNFTAKGFLPTNFWSRFESPAAAVTSRSGLAGIGIAAVVAAAAGAWRVRADITA
jgi:hypothetical protein